MSLNLHKLSPQNTAADGAALRQPSQLSGTSAAILGQEVERAEVEAQRKSMRRSRLRLRAIGFAAIVLAAVIFLPRVFEANPNLTTMGAQTVIPPVTANAVSTEVRLDEPNDQAQKNSQAVDLNPSTVTPSAPAAANSLAQANPVSAVAAQPAPVEAGSAMPPVEVTSVQAPTPAATPAPASASNTSAAAAAPAPAAAAPAAEAAAPKNVWIIQILASSSKSYAQEKAAAVRDIGLPSYVDSIQRNGSTLWRVRIGPYKTQEEARAERDKLAFAALPSGALLRETAP